MTIKVTFTNGATMTLKGNDEAFLESIVKTLKVDEIKSVNKTYN